MSKENDLQREYYAKTAKDYDEMHLFEAEHEFALSVLSGLLSYYNIRSLLDVGAGTGRVIRYLKEEDSSLSVCGIEPVEELRKIGHQAGMNPELLTDGNALNLPFEDDQWDLVCAFGILHHISEPNLAIAEMCRVSRYGVFFSDNNNFGCGGPMQRAFSQTLKALGLWRSFQWVKNGGKHWKMSQGDGLFYSYSLFNSLKTIRKKFPQTHLFNTAGQSGNIFRGCSHTGVFATRDRDTLSKLNPRAKKFSESDRENSNHN